MKEHIVLGVHVQDLDNRELEHVLGSWLNEHVTRQIVTPNPEMVLLAHRDETFRERLNRADLSLPDGFGLQLVNRAIAHRHTGVDTLERIVALAAQRHARVLLLGGEHGEAEATAQRFAGQYPGLVVRALDPGKIGQDGTLDEETWSHIEAFAPDVIAVAFGQGKQEAAMGGIAKRLPSARILIGVGGAFNMLSGRLRRAPAWMRRSGLEWLWRLLLQPSRFPRIFRATVVFPLTVFCARLKH